MSDFHVIKYESLLSENSKMKKRLGKRNMRSNEMGTDKINNNHKKKTFCDST